MDDNPLSVKEYDHMEMKERDTLLLELRVCLALSNHTLKTGMEWKIFIRISFSAPVHVLYYNMMRQLYIT